MLIIRPEQRQQLEDYALQQHVRQTLEQFQQFFPRHCQIIGAKPMRRMIRLGVDRAERHGIADKRYVTLYTSLMLLFGSYFDQDPQFPWVVGPLKDKSLTEQRRAEQLYDTGVEQWERQAGPDNADLVKALIRMQKVEYAELGGDDERQVAERLRRLFPSKASALRPAGLSRVLRQAGLTAKRHGLSTPAGRGAAVLLVFLLGSYFDEDPMYPWAAEALQPAADPGQNDDPASRLIAAGEKYLSAWLAHVPKENA